jgi:hypothetical protein
VAVGEGITTGEGVAIGGGVIVARPGNKGKPLFTAPKLMPRNISKAPRVPSMKRVAKGKGLLTDSPSIFPPLIGRMPNKKAKKPHKNRMTSKGELKMIFRTSCMVASLCG